MESYTTGRASVSPDPVNLTSKPPKLFQLAVGPTSKLLGSVCNLACIHCYSLLRQSSVMQWLQGMSDGLLYALMCVKM